MSLRLGKGGPGLSRAGQRVAVPNGIASVARSVRVQSQRMDGVEPELEVHVPVVEGQVFEGAVYQSRLPPVVMMAAPADGDGSSVYLVDPPGADYNPQGQGHGHAEEGGVDGGAYMREVVNLSVDVDQSMDHEQDDAAQAYSTG
eukprot:CAMPEP_0202869292 /NCGR_PEP_ID=MMETSP1391-20130828/12375_1 /ASSEMBLY_ACC=CAM_ASM_000867 /TAXON_ID=1034604 /ORGANISM="Chlamydomonas leiostraca, Strain SAG 11-49" /LENGTH=143 /DNA_ID=CAMNT_0049549601 /DNA_START=175 /DNA_END=603 /DNA_ORIENTATION=-